MSGLEHEAGRAVVEGDFVINGRGHVLVVTLQAGVIPRNGYVTAGADLIRYQGPEFVDTVGRPARLGVIVPMADFAALRDATVVSFSAA